MNDSIAFVHLSDIHFGQEKNGYLHINGDIKEQLIEDVRSVAMNLPNRKAAGILVTGDVAYSGKKREYDLAGAWLDRLTAAAGCDRTAVMMVPGNHDIDLGTVERGSELMLDDIKANGVESLEKFLASDNDRDTLYRRFEAYQTFSAAYNSTLDREGGMPEAQSYYLLSDQSKTLRFVGLNSALTCYKGVGKGELLLGRRQWPIHREAHQEVVVLIHHPLDWLRDSEESRSFIMNRARVLISGHEHDPKLTVVDVEGGGHLMMLAAGATARPENESDVAYTYNVLEFEWLAAESQLAVTVHPRVWNEERKCFLADDVRLGGKNPVVKLRGPDFTACDQKAEAVCPSPDTSSSPCTVDDDKATALSPGEDMNSASDIYPQLRFRFFRELSSRQRVSILVALNALPEDLAMPITHADERRALERLRRQGSLVHLRSAIDTQQQQDAQQKH